MKSLHTSPAMFDGDDDEQFLYGDEGDDVPSAPSDYPALDGSNGTPAISEPEGDANGGDEEEGDDSDDDFEIILDADPNAPAPPPPVRRPVIAVRPPAPLPTKVAEPATATPVDATVTEAATESPAPESSALAVPAPVGLVPHGSLTPFGVGAAPLAAETHPNLDVDFVHKDKDGNDLFDLDIDAIEDKSWRKPGANMADYFNYGMNEPAWKNYARKQRLTRQEESAEKNPFAAFASGNLQESWQSLAPEFKAVMMATIMGYQPAMNPQQAQQGMMSMMGGMGGHMGAMGGHMGGMGMGGMGGMGGYGMAGMGQQMGYNGYGAQHPAAQAAAANGFGAAAAQGFESPRPAAVEGAEGEAIKTEDGVVPVEGADGDVDMATPGMEAAFGAGYDPAAFGAPTGPGRGRGALRGRGVVPRGAAFAARGGRGGAQVGVPRAPSPLPANVPTGPRNPGPSSAARRDRSGYQDKDRQLPSANEGLDYGGGASAPAAKDGSPVPARSRRESLPPRRETLPRRPSPSGDDDRDRGSRSGKRDGRDRERSDRDRERERERERDREPRDRDSRDSRDARDRERDEKPLHTREKAPREAPRDKPEPVVVRERQRTMTPERPKPVSRRGSAAPAPGVDSFFPDKQAPVVEEPPAPVVGIKIRGATKRVEQSPPAVQDTDADRRARRERELPTGPAADDGRGVRRGESEGRSRRSARGGSGEDEPSRISSRRSSHRTEPDDDLADRRRSRTSRQEEEDEAHRAAAEADADRGASRRSRRHHWDDDDDRAAHDDSRKRKAEDEGDDRSRRPAGGSGSASTSRRSTRGHQD